jgi:hypothetical protein
MRMFLLISLISTNLLANCFEEALRDYAKDLGKLRKYEDLKSKARVKGWMGRYESMPEYYNHALPEELHKLAAELLSYNTKENHQKFAQGIHDYLKRIGVDSKVECSFLQRECHVNIIGGEGWLARLNERTPGLRFRFSTSSLVDSSIAYFRSSSLFGGDTISLGFEALQAKRISAISLHELYHYGAEKLRKSWSSSPYKLIYFYPANHRSYSGFGLMNSRHAYDGKHAVEEVGAHLKEVEYQVHLLEKVAKYYRPEI